jgi:hypothetical protein
MLQFIRDCLAAILFGCILLILYLVAGVLSVNLAQAQRSTYSGNNNQQGDINYERIYRVVSGHLHYRNRAVRSGDYRKAP